MTQGYIVLATGKPAYVDMAMNLAASLRVLDPSRPICLVHDAGLDRSGELSLLFDHFVPLAPDPLYPHVMNKLRVFDLSPYHETMFVDADCLLVKKDIDVWWAECGRHFFGSGGNIIRGGEWKGVDVRPILRAHGAEYMVMLNAGVFYFRKDKEGTDFFRALGEFYLANRERLSITNYKGPRSQSFEFYLGLFMGLHDLKRLIVGNRMDGGVEHSWMVSTWRSIWCDFAPERGRSWIFKADGFIGNLPFLPTRIVRLSPTFAHFIGLRPARTYAALAARFRHEARALERRPAA
jgi:hypothetical protein